MHNGSQCKTTLTYEKILKRLANFFEFILDELYIFETINSIIFLISNFFC